MTNPTLDPSSRDVTAGVGAHARPANPSAVSRELEGGRRRKRRVPSVLTALHCGWCQVAFSRPVYDSDEPRRHYYCSRKCQGAGYTATHCKTYSCGACGKKFRARPSVKVHARTFCSRKCSDATPRPKLALVTKACTVCGRKFESYPSQKRQMCSYACRKKYPNPAATRREMERRRLVRLRAIRADVGSHTHEQWTDLQARAGHRCVKCRRKQTLTRDHIIPLTKGGTDLITNIQPLCVSCNSRKNNRVENLL